MPSPFGCKHLGFVPEEAPNAPDLADVSVYHTSPSPKCNGRGHFSDPRLGIDIKQSPDMVGPKLGVGLKVLATLLGRVPSDSHAWIVTNEAPAFVRFEGTLSITRPVWRIESTSPLWPD